MDDLELTRLAERIEARATEELVRAAPSDLVASLGLACEWIGAAFRQQAAGVDVLAFNRAFHVGMTEPMTEARVDEILAAFAKARAPRFFVQVAPGAEPAALPAWLEARGLRVHNRWMRLVADPNVRLPVGAVPHGWRIEHIGPDEASVFAAIDARAFGHPREVEPWTAALVGRAGFRHYLAFDGDIPIGTGAFFVEDHVAWFGYASTVEAYRGKGVQSALIAYRLAEARLLGCRLIAVETAEDRPEKPAPSYRNLSRLGFRTLHARENWIGIPAAEPGRTPG